ncbi:MAG: thiamine pyrophosphate-dependent dehydrogenase E1 component subunit alpha, partial [Aquiluna sp.]
MATLRQRYSYMVWMREFELACLEGVPTREIHGELHTAIGQEAIGAGMAGFLRADDAMCSTHRNHLHAIAKGVDMRKMLAEIFERESGLCGGFGGHMHLMDPSLKFSATGIVGAGMPVAAGHAYAARLRGSDNVAVAVVGDGAVNTGAFHEAMNIAGVLKLPMVVVVENNEWAISVP